MEDKWPHTPGPDLPLSLGAGEQQLGAGLSPKGMSLCHCCLEGPPTNYGCHTGPQLGNWSHNRSCFGFTQGLQNLNILVCLWGSQTRMQECVCMLTCA